MEIKKYSLDYAGKPLSVEVGRLAGQANGSCTIQYGNTVVLVTATMSSKAKDVDFFPLTVDYEERYYAAGKIKGSKWLKREGRPSEEAILSARLIDRSIRPRFNQGMRNEIQIVALILSFDGENDADIISQIGASIALGISDIPFNGPVAASRVARVAGELIINPTYAQRALSDMDIVVAGTANRINMLEAGAKIISEEDMAAAVMAGFNKYQELIDFQNKIIADINPVKKEISIAQDDEELVSVIREFASPLLEKAVYVVGKKEMYAGVEKVKDELVAHITEKYASDDNLSKKLKEIPTLFEKELDRIVHKNILETEKRPDGRRVDELRSLSAQVGILPNCHGSGLFNRGNTQALTILTLASPGMEQWIETMEINLTKKRFMHHYVFPPFSVGEVGRMGGLGRREIGHGALAERALEPIMPNKDEFPYTIRVVSEILSSNGSSSMASVCGSSLAMMDGGVPIKSPAAGIAMGVMFDESGDKYKVLTDIQGYEDHYGDMDFKVAGTKDGVTAMQMDVKIEGITESVLRDTLLQAKKARLEILETITSTISKPREELSSHAPRIKIIKINPAKIGLLIGPGGKNINDIIDKTGATIDIDDDGSVFITSDSDESMNSAISMVNGTTYEPNAGDEFTGTVSRLFEFGAMVEYMPNKEGMVHISEISKERVGKVSDVLKLGQLVKVKVKNIDEKERVNLTMKF